MLKVYSVEALEIDKKLELIQIYFDTRRTPLSSFEKRHFSKSISRRKQCLLEEQTKEIMIGGTVVRHGYRNTGEFLYANEELFSLIWASFRVKNLGLVWNITKIFNIPFSEDFNRSFAIDRADQLIKYCSRSGFVISD